MPSHAPGRAEGGSPSNRTNWLHFAILVLSFIAARHRLTDELDSPVFGWRPADGGGIALNYFRNGFRFFFPQVLWGTTGQGYVEMEFPLIPFVTALLFWVFGTREYVNLIVPMASGFGLVWLTYAWGRRFFDARVGLVAAWLVAVTPVLVMLTNTGLWADPPMVLFATLGLYWVARWANGDERWFLALGIASVSLAVLLKLTALYVGLPIAYVFWKKYGVASLKSAAVWASAAGILVPSLLWYWHAHTLYVEYKNTFGILGAGYSKFGSAALLTNPYFYSQLVKRVALYHLTPLFTLGFVFGVRELWRRRAWLELSWLLSIVVYVVVAAHGVHGGHYHYLLPFLPIGALAGGLGVVASFERLRPLLRKRGEWLWRLAIALSAILFAATAALAERRFETRDRAIDSAMWLKKKRTGEQLKQLTTPRTLIIVVDSHMDGRPEEKSMTPPDVFYFSDRRGWYLSAAWLSVDKIESLHEKGATVLVVSGQSVADFKARRKDMLDYLTDKYSKIMDGDVGLAFALDRPR